MAPRRPRVILPIACLITLRQTVLVGTEGFFVPFSSMRFRGKFFSASLRGNKGNLKIDCGPVSLEIDSIMSKQPAERPPAAIKDVCNIVVLGCTGHGKSATCNTLSEAKGLFEESDSFQSATKVVSSREFEHDGQWFNTIDTPGFFDPDTDKDEIQRQLALIGNCAQDGNLSAVLIVMKKEREHEQNVQMIDYVEQLLDGKMKDFAVLVLTSTDMSSALVYEQLQQLSEQSSMRNLSKMLGPNRICTLQNRPFLNVPFVGQKSKQRKRILAICKDLHKRAIGNYRLSAELHRRKLVIAEKESLQNEVLARPQTLKAGHLWLHKIDVSSGQNVNWEVKLECDKFGDSVLGYSDICLKVELGNEIVGSTRIYASDGHVVSSYKANQSGTMTFTLDNSRNKYRSKVVKFRVDPPHRYRAVGPSREP